MLSVEETLRDEYSELQKQKMIDDLKNESSKGQNLTSEEIEAAMEMY